MPLRTFTALLLGRLASTCTGRIGWLRSRRLAGLRIDVVISGRHSCADQRSGAGCHLDAQDRVPRDILLARTATGPLTRYDRAALEDLAAPDAPGLLPLQRACQAGVPERAVGAEALGELERAKAQCADCPVREACLAGALARREPWGVWGGEIFERGAVIARKRPRGRPRKNATVEPAAAKAGGDHRSAAA